MQECNEKWLDVLSLRGNARQQRIKRTRQNVAQSIQGGHLPRRGVAVGTFRSSNGRLVKIAVETRNASGIFGKDFISGGLRDYATQYSNGYWITARSSVHPSNVDQSLREIIYSVLGSPPITMPETYASHLVVHIWDGLPNFSEEQLLSKIGEKIQQYQITLDRERLERTRAKEIAELRRRIDAAKAQLQQVNSRKLSWSRGEKERLEAHVDSLEQKLRDKMSRDDE